MKEESALKNILEIYHVGSLDNFKKRYEEV